MQTLLKKALHLLKFILIQTLMLNQLVNILHLIYYHAIHLTGKITNCTMEMCLVSDILHIKACTDVEVLTHGLCITAHMVNSFFGNAM